MATTKMNCHICQKKLNNIITKNLRGGEKRDVYFCSNCELGMLENKQTETGLKKFYAEEYRTKPNLTSQSKPKELFDTFSPLQANRLKLLLPHFTKKTKLLEVGCSAGMFLHEARKHVGEIVGIDFDIASAKYAAKKCGCKVYTTEIHETPLPKKYFDIIVAFQTLEHVSDPKIFISGLKDYLKPGGVLAIEVPNLYDSLAHIYNLPNHYKFFFHAAHLWYFTEKSLDKLTSSLGFKGKVYHQQDYNILNHFHWTDADTTDPQSFKRLGPPLLPLRLEKSAKIKKELANFILNTDEQYKRLLSKLKITSNIMFIGKNKESHT